MQAEPHGRQSAPLTRAITAIHRDNKVAYMAAFLAPIGELVHYCTSPKQWRNFNISPPSARKSLGPLLLEGRSLTNIPFTVHYRPMDITPYSSQRR